MTTALVLDRPGLLPDTDDPDKDNLIHLFCRRCRVHPDGIHCTAYCGKKCKVPTPAQGQQAKHLPGPRCVVCEELRHTHHCPRTPQ